jgi:hypothetical protein
VAQLFSLGGYITMKKHIITLLGLVLLVGCVSRPQNTTASHPNAKTSLVATCLASQAVPTVFNIMTLLKDKNIDAIGTISGTAWIYVAPDSAAQAREILSHVVADERFKGLEVVK